MSLDQEMERLIITFLSYVYAAIPWGKMRTAKNPWDIFNHRVRAAARQGSLYAFASRLANYFGLQHLSPEAINILDLMREDEVRVLNAIYTEHIPLCMLAIMEAKKRKQKNKQGGLYDDTEV